MRVASCSFVPQNRMNLKWANAFFNSAVESESLKVANIGAALVRISLRIIRLMQKQMKFFRLLVKKIGVTLFLLLDMVVRLSIVRQ